MDKFFIKNDKIMIINDDFLLTELISEGFIYSIVTLLLTNVNINYGTLKDDAMTRTRVLGVHRGRWLREALGLLKPDEGCLKISPR